MATIKKMLSKRRGLRWKAEVCKLGVRVCQTFGTQTEAKAWASEKEREIQEAAGRIVGPGDKTFGDLMDKYAEEVSPRKKGARWEVIRLALVRRDPLALVRLADLKAPHVTAWRDRRGAQVSEASVLREWQLLSAVCNTAVKDWHWLDANPFSGPRRPSPSKPRSRRVTEEEIQAISLALGYAPDQPPQTATARVGAAFAFALATAMRCGEICALRWPDIQGRATTLHDTKNGDRRVVPLSTSAMSILAQISREPEDDRVFRLTPAQVDALFRKGKARALVKGLHFHDSRREALTRMAEKVSVLELARISGHKDLRILSSVYYSPDPEDLARKLD